MKLRAPTVLAMVSLFAIGVHCKSKAPAGGAPAAGAASVAPPPAPAPVLPALVITSAKLSTSSSALALGRAGDVLYAFVADEDGHALSVVNATSGALVDTVALPGAPGHVVVHRGGLAVGIRNTTELRTITLRGEAKAPKLVLDDASLSVPLDPLALLSRGDSLLVASASSATLAEVGTAPGKAAMAQVRLPRDPRALVATDDGALRIAHATGSTLTTVAPDGSVDGLSMDLGETCTEAMVDECMTTVKPPSLQSYAVATFGKFVLVPSVSSLTDGPFPVVVTNPPARPDLGDPFARVAQSNAPPSQAPAPPVPFGFDADPTTGGYGGGNVAVPITFRIDTLGPTKAPFRLANTAPDGRFGVHDCTLPRGMAVDTEGGQLWVACLGEGKITRHLVKETARALDVRAKDSVDVPGVTAVAFDAPASTLVAYAPFARKLSFFALDKGKAGAPRTVDLPALAGERAISEELRRGRELFFTTDRRISMGKKACASCHPDGGDDGLAWPTPEGKRRTLGLAGRLGDEGFGWRGAHGKLETHIKNTITINLRGKGLPDADLAALSAYVRSMKAPAARPLSTEAARGKVVFSGATADCASCHVPSRMFSDGLPHDVGGGAFRTPSLIGIAGRGRFFHDGRYRSLDELLTGTNGKMGQTAALSPADRAALKAYVETL